MYVHAYQSYVWNEVLSQRIEMYGDKPVIGDLIVVEESKKQVAEDDSKEEKEEDEEGLQEVEKSQEVCTYLF
jgi:tRNA pseudouridine13 synthase